MDVIARLQAATGRDRATIVGITLSLAWLLLVLLFWLMGPEAATTSSGLVRLGAVIGVLTPLALIWLAVGLARSIGQLRKEAEVLRTHLADMRRMPKDDDTPDIRIPSPAPVSAKPIVTPKQTPAPPPRSQTAPDARQTALRFDTPESISVDMDDFVRAVNFPDGPDDRDTIAALRAALRDHDAARVLRAGQDVITLLAAAGIYMDHLQPDETDLSLWRRFAEGARGEGVQRIGAISDEDALQRAADLLKGDEIFRDAAHHFLRYFDLSVTRWAPGLSDAQLLRLADSRSARAFMLLGRVAGIFD